MAIGRVPFATADIDQLTQLTAGYLEMQPAQRQVAQMIDSHAFHDCKAGSKTLLQRSRETRAQAGTIRSTAKATRQAVADLIQQSRKIGASLQSENRLPSAARADRTGREPMTARQPCEGAFPSARIPASSVLLQVLAGADLREEDLDDLVEDLAAAYADAQAWDDETMCALLRRALKQIGCHLAQRLGPKAAGLALN